MELELAEPLQRYCTSTVSKMAAVRHLEFKKHRILTADGIKRRTLQYRTKFGADPPRRCRDIAIFVQI